MKTTTLLLMTALIVGLGAACHAETAIGSIVAFEGKATATRAQGGARGLALKSPIYLRDKVVTSKETRLQILFDDSSLVSQGAESEMVIDEYVYSKSSEKDGKCGIKLSKGVFRVITGRITEINPDRFKVRTRMATIGIRGCEIGFDIGAAEELIYVLELPPGHTMIIEPHVGGAGQPGGNVIEAPRPGLMFSLGQGGIRSQEMTPGAARHVVDHATPGAGINGDPDRPMGHGQDEGGPRPTHGTPTGEDIDTSDPEFRPREIIDNTVHDPLGEPIPDGDKLPDNLFSLLTDHEIKMLIEFTGLTRLELASLEDQKLLFLLDMVRAEWFAQSDDGTLPPPDGNDPPPDGGDNTSGGTGDPPPEPVKHPQNGGQHWGWAKWTLDGMPYEVRVGSSMGIDVTKFQNILGGATPHDLYANGVAAAVITHMGVPRFVEGTSNLDFHIGYGSHFWNGTFDMYGGPGDRLYFSVFNGDVTPEGKLVPGTLDSYYLMADDMFFDGPSWSFLGRLVGQNASHLPTGAIGNFDFQHGNAVTAQGIFGADIY